MKKIISKLLLAAILLSLVSCSDESLPSDSANDKPSDSDQTTETLPTDDAFNSVGYIYRTLIQNESNAFASTFAKNETRTNEKISEFIEEFSK